MQSNLIKHKLTVMKPNFRNKEFINFDSEREIQFTTCTVERDINKETDIVFEVPFSELAKVETLYNDVLDILTVVSATNSLNYAVRVYEGTYAHTAIITKFTIEDLEKQTIKFFAKGIQHFFKKMNIMSLLLNSPYTEENFNKIVVSGETSSIIDMIVNYAKASSVTASNFEKSVINSSESFSSPVTSKNTFFSTSYETFGGYGTFSTDKINLLEVLNELEFNRKTRIIFEDYIFSNNYFVRFGTYTNKVINFNSDVIKNVEISYDTDKIKYLSFATNKKENFDFGNNDFRNVYAFNASMRLPDSLLYKAEVIEYDASEKKYSKNALYNKCFQSVQSKYSAEYSYDIELNNIFKYGEFKIGDTARVKIDVFGNTKTIEKKITGYMLELSSPNVVNRILKIGE